MKQGMKEIMCHFDRLKIGFTKVGDKLYSSGLLATYVPARGWPGKMGLKVVRKSG